jgi:hypothetical protein
MAARNCALVTLVGSGETSSPLGSSSADVSAPTPVAASASDDADDVICERLVGVSGAVGVCGGRT